MRAICVLLSGAALIAPSPAVAADQLKFGAAPAWVVAQTIPPASAKTQGRPVAILLHDQQTMLEPGKISTFSELAFKIQKPEGLAAGNLSIAWNPATETVTVNRLEIRRGDQVVDVLKSGQTFTTMRRESNLELATLDGVLTANIQPEGLQEGDVIVLASTIEHADPVLKGHVETVFAPWGSAQIGFAHARLLWPAALDVKVQKTGEFAPPQQSTIAGRRIYELTMRDVEPVVEPKGAPIRFKIGRLGDATDFHSWADVARLFMPLFRDAAVIPATGALRDEVEKIRKASSDPRVRTEQALELVQQRTRYVALLMGQGSLVPAPAEATWSRRFGDCKAKTALLLGILHELGIKAEPVLANPIIGDAVGDQPPMVGMFNHVLVRAHVGGKDYWLDGTRTADASLDRIHVPSFGWVLPLVDNAQLVHIVPPPLEHPGSEVRIDVDASAGVYAPAKIAIEEVMRGDAALAFDRGYTQLSAEQRNEYLHQNAKNYFDTISGDSATEQFDEATGELHLSTKGTAKLDWKDSWYSVPSSSIGFTPDFDRPAGPQHDAPIATSYPNFDTRVVTIKLPPGFAAGQKKLPTPVHETLAGIEYGRAISLSGDVLKVESSERGIAPEVLYKDALAAAPRLRALDKDDVYLQVPGGYGPTAKDLAGLGDATPGSGDEYVARGNLYLDGHKYDEAIADFTAALKLDPGNKWAHVDRGLAYVWKRQFDEADKDLSVAAVRDPDNAVTLRAQGLMSQFKGDCTKAVEFYTRSSAKEPDDSFSLGHRAECEASLSKWDAALADSSAALKADPKWLDLRILRANIYLREGKRDLVAAEADALTRENPQSDFAWVGAARSYAAAGQMEKAMHAFDEALKIKPLAYIYVNRAQVRPNADSVGRVADLDAALKLEPGNADALAEKARLLASRGDYKGALVVLDGVKTDPTNRYAQVQRAIVMFKAGKPEEARRIFEVVSANAKTSTDFNSLCWTKATADVMLESALQDCRDALKLSPDTGAYLDSLGMALLKLGKLNEALGAYDQAIAKNTGAASLMGRAFVYLRMGDRAHAESDAAAARKLSATIDDTFAEYGLKFDEPGGVATAGQQKAPAGKN